MSVTKGASVVNIKFILQQTEHRTITVTAAIMPAECFTAEWRVFLLLFIPAVFCRHLQLTNLAD
jgi:hypothetical protein